MHLPLEGDDDHVRGYILNKLYIGRYWVKPRKQPKRHTSELNLPKSYSPEHRGKFPGNIDWLVRERLIYRFPHSGDSKQHVCAILDPSTTEKGLSICNRFRLSVGLPELDSRFREIYESDV